MSSSTATECGFEGNADLYGLGIRIGYYTQALAAFIANWFVLSEVYALRKTNTLFLFAAIIALIVYVSNPSEIYAIEGFAPLQIGRVLGTVAISRQTARTEGHLRLSVWQLATLLVMRLATSVYSLFYWSKGLDAMKPTPCGTYFFLFAKLSLYGHARYVMLGISVFIAFFDTVVRMPWDVSILLRSIGLRNSKTQFEQWAQQHDPEPNLSQDSQGLDIEQVLEAERFLETLFTPVSQQKDAHKIEQPLQYGVQITRPRFDWAGIHRQLRASWALFKVNTFDFDSTKPRVMIATHFRELPPPRPTWVDIIGRMLEARKEKPLPNWHVLGLASEIQITQSPPKTELMWKRQANSEVWYVIFLIVQLETTLAWNSIREVNTIKSIGQLIPFIVGLGGLTTVLWKKKDEIQGKRRGEQYVEREPPSAFRDAVEVYSLWKVQKLQKDEATKAGAPKPYSADHSKDQSTISRVATV